MIFIDAIKINTWPFGKLGLAVLVGSDYILGSIFVVVVAVDKPSRKVALLLTELQVVCILEGVGYR
jgi:hypothetical protein